MESDGIYSIAGMSITLNLVDGEGIGAIEGNVINVTESGTIIKFTKH